MTFLFGVGFGVIAAWALVMTLRNFALVEEREKIARLLDETLDKLEETKTGAGIRMARKINKESGKDVERDAKDT